MQIDKVLEAYKRNDENASATAKELGLSRSTVRSYLQRAARRGKTGAPLIGSTHPGFNIKRVSTLYNKDGTPSMEWVIQSPDGEKYELLLDAIEDRLDRFDGIIPEIPLRSEDQNSDLLTVYPIADHHLGLYAWEPETGANYDLKIGEETLRNTFGDLVSRTPASRTAVILQLGDFFHSDDDTKRTRRSGNQLDVDGRSAKILEAGVDLEIYTIELALQKHECVEVRNLRGNHDPDTSIALNVAVRKAFSHNPRVHVSRDPGPFYFRRFGRVLIGATHGDFTKPTELPGIMAAYAPKEWGETEHRYFYFGHIHHSSKGGGEQYGAIWESFRTLAPRDAWATASGYAAGRGMVAITHHKDTGEKYRDTITIAGPGFKQGL